jgi:hypothetical protein
LPTGYEAPAQIKHIVEVASETVIEIPDADDLNQQQLRDIVAKLQKA